MRGVHIQTLQELLGHKTLAMTQRYSQLAPEQLQKAVKLLDGMIGESGTWAGRQRPRFGSRFYLRIFPLTMR
jgi:hypothetical protein